MAYSSKTESYLQTDRRIADRHGLDSGELRPCVALMLDDGKNGVGKREHRAYLIAVDLKHMGVEHDGIMDILTNANVCSRANARSAVQSSKLDKYKRWACESNTMKFDLDQIRQHYCIGANKCFWLETHKDFKTRKFDSRADNQFEKLGWHHICTANEQLLYNTIRELERIHSTGTGGLVIASHDKLAFMVGCKRRSIKNVVEGLASKGLIAYRPGDPSRQEKRASRIKRTIPIPEPSPAHERALAEFDQFNRMGRID